MSSAQNTVLQLLPPKVRLATDPVIGARIGVPLHAVIFYNPRTGVKSAEVTIDPPIVGTIKKGDDLRLWATDDPTLVGPVAEQDSGLAIAPILLDAISIEEDDPAEPMQMYIAGSAFLVGVVLYLFYTIDRPSGNVGASQALTLIHNRIRPGLKDRLTVAGGHSELKFRLSDAIKNGVGPDFVSAQVAVEYPYCRAYDRILFKCNGETMEIGVSADEAPKPPDHGSEIVTTINFTVNRAFLERAKRIDHLLSFLFTAFDQLDNSADPDAQWSPPQTVDEDLDGTRFTKPILREQLNDPSDKPEIDLGKLKDNPLLIVIVPTDIRFVAGYEVTTFYYATRTDHADIVDEQTATVEVDEFGQKQLVVIKVPNQKVSIPGSTVRVHYEVRQSDNGDGTPGDLVGKSNTTTAIVVGEAVSPTIANITDSKGTVAPNGTTFDTSVSATGKASPNQTVQLYDGNTSLTPVVPVDANGNWSKVISGLSFAAHPIKAKALYGAQPESAVRSFTVMEDALPTIDSVIGSPSNIEIPDGGSTSNTTIKLTGKAAKELSVDVLDGATSKGQPKADATGIWTFTAAFVAGPHNITARALYGTGKTSAVRKFNVIAALAIDQSVMNLDAVKFVQSYGWGTKEVPGNVLTRQAQGGTPPYSYQSDNPAVASVTAGKVSGLKNGTTTIRVRDASGASVSFGVNVKNVYRVTKGSTTYSGEAGSIAAQQWIRSQGGLDLVQIYNIWHSATLNANFTNVLGDLLEGIQYGSPLASWMYTYNPYMDAYRSRYVSWSNGISIHTGVLGSPFRALFVVPS